MIHLFQDGFTFFGVEGLFFDLVMKAPHFILQPLHCGGL